MNYLKVYGVHIDLDQMGSPKSLKDLKTNSPKVFDHLSKDDQDKAYAELWAKGYDKSVDQSTTPAPGPEAATAAPSADAAK